MPSNLSDDDLNFLQKDKDLLGQNPANKKDFTQNEEDFTTNYIEPEKEELPDDSLPHSREPDVTPRNF